MKFQINDSNEGNFSIDFKISRDYTICIRLQAVYYGLFAHE